MEDFEKIRSKAKRKAAYEDMIIRSSKNPLIQHLNASDVKLQRVDADSKKVGRIITNVDTSIEVGKEDVFKTEITWKNRDWTGRPSYYNVDGRRASNWKWFNTRT